MALRLAQSKLRMCWRIKFAFETVKAFNSCDFVWQLVGRIYCGYEKYLMIKQIENRPPSPAGKRLRSTVFKQGDSRQASCNRVWIKGWGTSKEVIFRSFVLTSTFTTYSISLPDDWPDHVNRAKNIKVGYALFLFQPTNEDLLSAAQLIHFFTKSE